MHVCVCVHAVLIQYKTLQFIPFLLKKLSENIRQNVTKSAKYKSVEVRSFKLHSYKFVNHCGILFHESESSGYKDTTEVLNSSFFFLFPDTVCLVLVYVSKYVITYNKCLLKFLKYSFTTISYILILFKLILLNIIFSIS